MSRDEHGSTIVARDLPRGCKPPYRARTVWEGHHRGWRIIVSRIEGDPLPHVVVGGHNPTAGRYEAHAERQHGATPATVRAWVDHLLASPAASHGVEK